MSGQQSMGEVRLEAVRNWKELIPAASPKIGTQRSGWALILLSALAESLVQPEEQSLETDPLLGLLAF